jgi:hypothetical protein
MRHLLRICLLVTLASPAGAVIVPAGGTEPLSGTTLAARPELACNVIVPDLLTPFSISFGVGQLGLSGTLQSQVCQNEYGFLDFYYRVENSDVSGDLTEVLGLVLGDPTDLDAAVFDSPMDIDWRADGLGDQPPALVRRGQLITAELIACSPLCMPLPPTGDGVVGFEWSLGVGVGAGESSHFMFVRTAATNFKVASFATVWGGNASAVYEAASDSGLAVYVPIVPGPGGLPEPGPTALLAVGAVGIAVRRARRRGRRGGREVR